MQTDLQLLSRYHQRGDALAFRELVNAHAGMVFATARRVTCDAAMAEDVAQETFVQLAKASQGITESVAAWLHRVAWRRACNAVRADATRKRYEEAASAVTETKEEAPWSEVEPVLDELIDELPESMRCSLVMHFLENRSQRDIANALGVNQSTVSRNIDAGIGELRLRLRDRGVLCGAGLGALMLANTSSAVPATLVASLGKLGLSGIGGVTVVGSGLAWSSLQTKVAMAVAALVVVGGAITMFQEPKVDRMAMKVTAIKSNASPRVMPAPAMSSTQPKAKIAQERAASVQQGSVVDVRSLSAATSGQRVSSAKHQTQEAATTPDVALSRLGDRQVAPVASSANLPPQRPRAKTRPNSRTLPAGSNASVAGATPVAVHELVHSFPMPPRMPIGQMVLDADGWLWGTTASGGEHGLGTLYRVRSDGSKWEEMASFGGKSGQPSGAFVRGVMRASDGRLWGTTSKGGAHDGGTLFCFDTATSELRTMVEFSTQTRVDPQRGLVEFPKGVLWGTTSFGVFRYTIGTSKLDALPPVSGAASARMAGSPNSGLVADGAGFLWGTSHLGTGSKCGAIYKVDATTGSIATVVQFTGKEGLFPGRNPSAQLAFDGKEWLWGTTAFGGDSDWGTVFKINAHTGAFVHVLSFKRQGSVDPGSNPESPLVFDDEGNIWGTTSFSDGYNKGPGRVFKIHPVTHAISVVVAFDGRYGHAPGRTSRSPLLPDGRGGFIGASDFGGYAESGLLYRVDINTGKFTTLLDFASLTKSSEGSEANGRLVAGSDGWLWGVTHTNAAAMCGSVFKFNPETNALVAVVNFTGTDGPFKGRRPSAGLIHDKQGFLWGCTPDGGAKDAGTIFKINERTGDFTTVFEFANQAPGKPFISAPYSGFVYDGKRCIWGSTMNAVFKFNMDTGLLSLIVRFTNAGGPGVPGYPHQMTMDDKGFVWGCSFPTNRSTLTKGAIFKINTVTDEFTVTQELDGVEWTTGIGFHEEADMCWDKRGFLWYAGRCEGQEHNRLRSLVKINALTGRIEAIYQQPGFGQITTPVCDDRGRLWGFTGTDGRARAGRIYTFDPATSKFAAFAEFTGGGPQSLAGDQPQTTRLMLHSDGNFYAGTRYGGPGNGGTIFRLRFGPTPMTQDATFLVDGRVELHGVIHPNGRDSDAAFEWSADASLKDAQLVPAGAVAANETNKPVSVVVDGLKPGGTYHFRVRASNAASNVPQRGAVLHFTMPSTSLASADENKSDRATDSGASAASSQSKLALKVIRVPGAGAGYVRGALEGAAYEVGKRYSLTAFADNGYIFDHWSGPGITGGRTESVLSFVFNEDLAKSPVITASFVLNPFKEDVIGEFNGLVRAVDGAQPAVANTGALRLNVSRNGSFSGLLRYDSDALPVRGVFDTGGLARFGAARLASQVIERKGKTPLVLSLQLDLSIDGAHDVSGSIGLVKGAQVEVQSIVFAARSYYDGRLHVVPGQYLARAGRYELLLNDDTPALMRVTASGSATFAAKLPDGVSVLSQSPLSQMNQAAFFAQLYAKQTGSIGGDVLLDWLLKTDDANRAAFWWFHPPQPASTLSLRLRPDANQSSGR